MIQQQKTPQTTKLLQNVHPIANALPAVEKLELMATKPMIPLRSLVQDPKVLVETPCRDVIWLALFCHCGMNTTWETNAEKQF